MKDKIYSSIRERALQEPEIRFAAEFASTQIDRANHIADRVSNIAEEIFHSEPIPIDQLASNMSSYADKMILSGKHENLSFLGGYLYASFDSTDQNNFSLDIKIYFKDSLGKNVLKESSKKVPFQHIDEQSQIEIKNKLKLTYPIIDHNN